MSQEEVDAIETKNFLNRLKNADVLGRLEKLEAASKPEVAEPNPSPAIHLSATDDVPTDEGTPEIPETPAQ